MKPLQRLAGLTLAASLLSGSAAAALTADEVWNQMQARATAFGMPLNVGSQTKTGGTLALKQVTADYADPKGNAKVSIALPEIDLAEAGDGSVTLTVPQPAKLDFSATDPKKGGGSAEGSVTIAPTNVKSVISGSPEDMRYASTGDSVVMTLDALKVDGKEVKATAQLAMTGFASTSHVTGSDPQQIDSQGTVQGMQLLLDASDPEQTGTLHLEATAQGMTNASKLTLPKAMDAKNMAASLAAGYAVSGQFGYGPISFTADATNPKGPAKISGSVGSGSVSVEMSKDRVQYGGQSKDVKFAVASPQLPVPQLVLTEAESAFSLTAPVAKADTPQNFALLLKILGLGVNEEVWTLLDPQNVLPHDPATLIVDLAGTGNLGFDLFDPTLAEHPPTDPGQIDTLKVNQLQLTAGGADLTGTDALSFENTPGAAPKPVGDLNLKLTGGNGLLDKLIQMGLLPQDQAMGFRMMLGMFSKPAGDDVLTSQIEFKPDGAILANGQRIK